MDANGAHQRALANDNSSDIAPALSPDGESVAFVTDRYTPGKKQLALLDVASGTVTRVVTDTFGHSEPTWSPDGEWIAFLRFRNDFADTLYKVHPDGSGLTPLKATVSATPTWDPAGGRIAYTKIGKEIWVLDLASGVDTAIVTSGNQVDRVQWSPDGTWLAYNDSGLIVQVHPDGTGKVTLPAGPHPYSHVSWSSDGSWLYAASNIDDTGLATNWEIYRVHMDGTGPQRLTSNGDASGGALDDWPAGGVAAP